ncbi:transposase [Caldiplasma sukawensis]
MINKKASFKGIKARNNKFQTALIEKYQRNAGITDFVLSMYSKKISKRDMAEIIEQCFITNIANSQYEE